MPEARLQRTREAYETSMGRLIRQTREHLAEPSVVWRAWHLNAAERLAQQAPKPPLHWNVIEGDHFTANRDPGDEG